MTQYLIHSRDADMTKPGTIRITMNAGLAARSYGADWTSMLDGTHADLVANVFQPTDMLPTARNELSEEISHIQFRQEINAECMAERFMDLDGKGVATDPEMIEMRADQVWIAQRLTALQARRKALFPSARRIRS